MWSSADLPNLIINFKKIDELFCQKPRAKSSPAVVSTAGGLSKAYVLNILDSKRSLAINIMLKQFKSGSAEILEALQNGSSIPIEKLKGLQRVLPTDDEVEIEMKTDRTDLWQSDNRNRFDVIIFILQIKKIKKQTSDLTTVGTAELFCLNLDNIPNYQLKIKLMIEVKRFAMTYVNTCDRIYSIVCVCVCVVSRKKNYRLSCRKHAVNWRESSKCVIIWLTISRSSSSYRLCCWLATTWTP